jgi:hypothetical protein
MSMHADEESDEGVIPLPDHFECAAMSSLLSKYHSPEADSIQIDLGSV